jgi:hypothetical protein
MRVPNLPKPPSSADTKGKIKSTSKKRSLLWIYLMWIIYGDCECTICINFEFLRMAWIL